MKKITGLKEIVGGMSGKPITLEGEDLTVTRTLAHFLASSHNKSAKQDFKSRKLAEKLFAHEADEILLENGEHELLKEVIEQNGPGFTAFVRGHVSELVEGATEVKVEEKKT